MAIFYISKSSTSITFPVLPNKSILCILSTIIVPSIFLFTANSKSPTLYLPITESFFFHTLEDATDYAKLVLEGHDTFEVCAKEIGII